MLLRLKGGTQPPPSELAEFDSAFRWGREEAARILVRDVDRRHEDSLGSPVVVVHKIEEIARGKCVGVLVVVPVFGAGMLIKGWS